MDHNAALVVDEAALPEGIHEIGDPRTRGSDHRCQSVVRDPGKSDRRALLGSNLGEF